MRNETDFKILLEALESSCIFICHLPTAQYVCDCSGYMKVTELLNKALLLVKV